MIYTKLLSLAAILVLAAGCRGITHRVDTAPPAAPVEHAQAMQQHEVEEALATRVNVEFDDIALEDLMHQLSDALNLAVQVDPEAQTAFEETQLTVHLEDVSIAEMLSAVLQPHGLDYAIDEQTLQILPA